MPLLNPFPMEIAPPVESVFMSGYCFKCWWRVAGGVPRTWGHLEPWGLCTRRDGDTKSLDLWKPFRKSRKSIKPLELYLLQVEKGELQTHALELNGPGRESCSCHRPHYGVWEVLSESLMSPWGASIGSPGNEDPPTYSRGHPADQVKLPPWTMSAEAYLMCYCYIGGVGLLACCWSLTVVGGSTIMFSLRLIYWLNRYLWKAH